MDVEMHIVGVTEFTVRQPCWRVVRSVIIDATLDIHNTELVKKLLYGSETWVL